MKRSLRTPYRNDAQPVSAVRGRKRRGSPEAFKYPDAWGLVLIKVLRVKKKATDASILEGDHDSRRTS